MISLHSLNSKYKVRDSDGLHCGDMIQKDGITWLLQSQIIEGADECDDDAILPSSSECLLIQSLVTEEASKTLAKHNIYTLKFIFPNKHQLMIYSNLNDVASNVSFAPLVITVWRVNTPEKEKVDEDNLAVQKQRNRIYKTLPLIAFALALPLALIASAMIIKSSVTKSTNTLIHSAHNISDCYNRNTRANISNIRDVIAESTRSFISAYRYYK